MYFAAYKHSLNRGSFMPCTPKWNKSKFLITCMHSRPISCSLFDEVTRNMGSCLKVWMLHLPILCPGGAFALYKRFGAYIVPHAPTPSPPPLNSIMALPGC